MTVVNALGSSADDIAAKLNAQITPADIKAWGTGTARDWALESFKLAKRDAYALPDPPTCDDHRSIALSPAYIATAQRNAAIQLEKAEDQARLGPEPEPVVGRRTVAGDGVGRASALFDILPRDSSASLPRVIGAQCCRR
jgi:hypothetical protein